MPGLAGLPGFTGVPVRALPGRFRLGRIDRRLQRRQRGGGVRHASPAGSGISVRVLRAARGLRAAGALLIRVSRSGRAALRGGRRCARGLRAQLFQPLLRPVQGDQRVRLVPACGQVAVQLLRQAAQFGPLLAAQALAVLLRGLRHLLRAFAQGLPQGAPGLRRAVRGYADKQQDRQRAGAGQGRQQDLFHAARTDAFHVQRAQRRAGVRPLQAADFRIPVRVFQRGDRPLPQAGGVRGLRRIFRADGPQRAGQRPQERAGRQGKERPELLPLQRDPQREDPHGQRRRQPGQQAEGQPPQEAVPAQARLHRAQRPGEFVVHP